MDARDNFKRTTVRLPQDLYDRIEAATVGKSSLNTLIIHALETAYPPPDRDFQDVLSKINDLEASVSGDMDPDDMDSVAFDLGILYGDVMVLAEKFQAKKAKG